MYKWVPAVIMLEVTLRWTSIPSRGGVAIFLVASCRSNRSYAPAWWASWLVCRLFFRVRLRQIIPLPKSHWFSEPLVQRLPSQTQDSVFLSACSSPVLLDLHERIKRKGMKKDADISDLHLQVRTDWKLVCAPTHSAIVTKHLRSDIREHTGTYDYIRAAYE